MKKLWKQAVALTSAFALVLGAAACGTNNTTTPQTTPGTPAGTDAPGTDPGTETPEAITLRFFSNLPDRTSGQGLLEQKMLDAYQAANQHVTIEVEALQDEPYKQKYQTYVSGNNLPDIFSVWGQPSFLEASMANGYLAELNEADYSDYQFFDGSFKDFSYDGKLYGLPRNQDITTIFINKALFEENDIKIPETYDELLTAVKAFRELDIQPLAINGKDKWTLNLFFQDLVVKVSGDQQTIYNASTGETTFAGDPDLRRAAELFQELVDAGIFQDSFVSADYGAAQNLFLQEQAAMFYMGAWEVGMASNMDNSEHFRENVDLIPFPVVSDGEGRLTDVIAWNGGGYSVSAASPVKEEAIKLLNYMMLPDNWAKTGWQEGLVVPAQQYEQYFTGNENILQEAITKILGETTSMSGTSWNDFQPGDWKTNVENIIQEFAAGIQDVDGFLEGLDQYVAER